MFLFSGFPYFLLVDLFDYVFLVFYHFRAHNHFLKISSCFFSRLLVECFTKYCVIREAIRHFRALKTFQGGTKALHNEGNFGDPLSLYLRALCREGIYQSFIVSDNKNFFVSFQIIMEQEQKL